MCIVVLPLHIRQPLINYLSPETQMLANSAYRYLVSLYQTVNSGSANAQILGDIIHRHYRRASVNSTRQR